MGYIFIGALLCIIFAIALGLLISYWLSIIFSLGYFIGLFTVIKITQKRTKFYELRLVFNMAMVLQAIN